MVDAGFLMLPGRVAVVTGGARGIGLAIARRLAQAGAYVVVADRDENEGERAAAAIRDTGGWASARTVDVADRASIEQLVADVDHAYGALDVFVNNAGITGTSGPIWEQTDDNWRRVLAIDLDGVFYACRAAVVVMRAHGRGTIVNVASISGKEGNPNMIPYSVAKAGVIALTKALAKELLDANVRVNAVAPGVVRTGLLDELAPDAVEYMRSKVPMGRFGTPEEVAAVVHFLASDDASFVTGQVYDASGGRATY